MHDSLLSCATCGVSKLLAQLFPHTRIVHFAFSAMSNSSLETLAQFKNGVWATNDGTQIGAHIEADSDIESVVMSNDEHVTAAQSFTPPSGQSDRRPLPGQVLKRPAMKRPAAAAIDIIGAGNPKDRKLQPGDVPDDRPEQRMGKQLRKCDSFSASLPNPLKLPLHCRTCGEVQPCRGDLEQTCMKCGDNDFPLIDHQ